MGTGSMVISVVVALILGAANILYWMWVVRSGDAWMRARVERWFGVTIVRGHRGHWTVASGPGGALRHFLIELLQIVYFLGAVVLWGVSIGLIVLLAQLLPG